MRKTLLQSILIFNLFALSMNSFSQSVVDEISTPTSTAEEATVNEVFTEKIVKIGESKHIFILSNSTNNLSKGDFFTILLNDELVARGLVAKTTDAVVGTKILKIYSMARWNRLSETQDVQIIRGDDSYYTKKLSAEKTDNKTDDDNSPKIQSEDDLYNESVVSEDIDEDENKNRAINSDNMISGGLGLIYVSDLYGKTQGFYQWSASWAYQLGNNVWGEAFYGTSFLSEYPAGGKDTTISNMVVRLKYAVSIPFDAYIFPYAGFQMIMVDSPGAGNSTSKNETAAQLEREKEMIKEIEKKGPIFGATVAKRLVPGWFLRLDVGTDVMAAGLALEF